MKRILVPTDFSAPSLQAVRYGIELTSTVEGKLLLLHVIEGEPTRYHAVGELPASLSYYIDLTVTIVGHQAPQEVIRQDLWRPTGSSQHCCQPERLSASTRWSRSAGRLTKSSEWPRSKVPTSSSWGAVPAGAGGVSCADLSPTRSSARPTSL